MPECSHKRPLLLGPWRRRFQWLVTLTIVGLPWIQPGGRSLLRIDLETLSLHLFGQLLRIEELYLLLFFSLLLVLLFLLVTLVLGRVWCGWACPQTTLSDLAEWMARVIGVQMGRNRLSGPRWRRLLVHLWYGVTALLVGANLVWYFIEPQRFFTALATWQLHPAAWVLLLAIAIPAYLDLALVRRLMCSDFCPYGRFQTALVDPGTLTLVLTDEERPRCIECGACVRSCPMGIDIRRGYQIECINCGRCLDACRKVMSGRNQDGLIHYRFGLEHRGPKALLNPRTLLLAGALAITTLVLGSAIWTRSEASLKIATSHTAPTRIIEDGRQVTFFTAWVNNRSQSSRVFELHVGALTDSAPLELKGQIKSLELADGKNRRVEFALVSPAVVEPLKVVFELRDRSGKRYARAEALVLPVASGDEHAR